MSHPGQQDTPVPCPSFTSSATHLPAKHSLSTDYAPGLPARCREHSGEQSRREPCSSERLVSNSEQTRNNTGNSGNQQKKRRTPVETGTKDPKRQFTHKETHGADKHRKRCSNSLVTRGTPMKTMTNTHFKSGSYGGLRAAWGAGDLVPCLGDVPSNRLSGISAILNSGYTRQGNAHLNP